MGKRRLVRHLLPCLLLTVLVSSQALAGEGTQPPPQAQGARANPTPPVRAEDRLARAEAQGEKALRDVVVALGEEGGTSALDALVPYLRHTDPEIRIASLQALRTIGLRASAAVHAVRRVARRSSGHERRLAIACLGRLGDARDVPFLLQRIEDDGAGIRAAALSSLRALSGARMPASPVRWRHWWKTVAPRQARALRVAMDALAKDSSGRASGANRRSVERFAWHDLPYVEERLETWLRTRASNRRALAADLSRTLRLSDLARWTRRVPSEAGGTPPARRATERTAERAREAAPDAIATRPGTRLPATRIAVRPPPARLAATTQSARIAKPTVRPAAPQKVASAQPVVAEPTTPEPAAREPGAPTAQAQAQRFPEAAPSGAGPTSATATGLEPQPSTDTAAAAPLRPAGRGAEDVRSAERKPAPRVGPTRVPRASTPTPPSRQAGAVPVLAAPRSAPAPTRKSPAVARKPKAAAPGRQQARAGSLSTAPLPSAPARVSPTKDEDLPPPVIRKRRSKP